MAVSSYAVPGTCAVQLLATASGFPPSTPACPASHFLSSILRIQAQTYSSQGSLLPLPTPTPGPSPTQRAPPWAAALRAALPQG